MSDSTCRICGESVPGNARYCNRCDFQQARDGRTVHEQSAPRPTPELRGERGSLSIFLLVFLVASVGTVGMGMTATPGFSIPSFKETLGLGGIPTSAKVADAGQLRTVSTRVRIRADRTTDSDIVGMLEPDDRVRADHLEGDWYAVFDLDATSHDPDAALGYVYAPLLKPVAMESGVAPDGGQESRS